MTPPPVSDPAVTDRPASRWALATFLLGLVSLIPLSLFAGIVALVKTRGGKQPGRGLAVAGIDLRAVDSGLGIQLVAENRSDHRHCAIRPGRHLFPRRCQFAGQLQPATFRRGFRDVVAVALPG